MAHLFIDYLQNLVFISLMTHPFEIAIVSDQCRRSQERIAQADQVGADVSAIAGEENLRILRAMDLGEQVATAYVDRNVEVAIDTGVHMFNLARKGGVDDEYVPDLVEGVNALVARVHMQAEAGEYIPMNYMDPNTRKQLFLVESAMRGVTLDSKE